MLPWRASASRKAARRAKAAADWGRAAQHYRRALERDPRSASTWVQYGNALRECGRTEEAEAAYRRSLALADDDPDAHVQLGHLLKQLRRGDEAIAAYLHALEIDPSLLHASQELIELGWTSHVKPPSTPPQRSTAAAKRPKAVVIDASDLLLHFLHTRLPTGIQRVQLQIIAAWLARPPREYDLLITCFAPCRDFWVGIPEDLFGTLIGLAVSGSATDERPWQDAVTDLTSLLVHGDNLDFPVQAALVNLGASWPHLNYFLELRNAKARYGIRFIPFVHDCVPVLLPELCVEATVRTYIDWLLGMFFHADGYLVNSESTARDLSKMAGLLGHRITPPQVVPLDGGGPIGCRPECARGRKIGRLIRRHRWVKPFVLFVSTFEPRKNHLMAFRLWLRLIEKRGLRRTPQLVCVGHRGWKTEAAMSLLRSNKVLQRRVSILTGIADAALAELYQRCLFTLYPSLYEGWGLPVTEALCHGKVPLVSAISSLPEAGGEFAEYFDPNSLDDLLAKTEQLLDKRSYRISREALIREKFRPRSWGAIADQVIDYALTTKGGAERSAGVSGLPAAIGRYYAFARNRETSIQPGMIAGEMFRVGDGWWTPEEWGCWLKHQHADIFFSLPAPRDFPCFLHLGLRGLPISRISFRLSMEPDGTVCDGILEPGQYQWPILRIESGEVSDNIRLRVTSNGRDNLAKVSGRIDRRVVSLGITGFYLSATEISSVPAEILPGHR